VGGGHHCPPAGDGPEHGSVTVEKIAGILIKGTWHPTME